MALFGKKKQDKVSKYPGIRKIMNGTSAVVMCERESSDAAGAYLSSSASEMSTLWNQEKDKGHLNISNRSLISVYPESNHAAAATTAGFSLSGLRATHFSSSTQSIASMHESLYAAVGKKLPYVLNMTCTATTKATSNHHCSHDDYHSMDDTGFIQFFAYNNQAAADLNLISRKIAELSLIPAVVAQDGFLTSHLIEPLNLPERELIEAFVGLPADIINTPTPAQKILFGKTRRRIPETWTVDQPIQTGGNQNPDSYMQTVAGQRPYFFDHINKITDQCMDEWFELTGRRYQRINRHLCKDADYLIIAQGSVINTAEITANYLRDTSKLKVGVVNLTVFRPFPGDLLSHIIKGKKAVLVVERSDQPMAEDLPIISELRACVSKAIDNGKKISFTDYASYAKTSDAPTLYSACFGLGGHQLKINDIITAVENMLPEGAQQKFAYLGIDFIGNKNLSPQQEIQQNAVIDAYPEVNSLALASSDVLITPSEDTKTIRLHSIGGWRNDCLGQSLAQTLFEDFDLEVKAKPFYDIEKKGQPTTFHLTVASKAFHLNTEYTSIDTVVAIDPNIFSYTAPLAGLAENGTFIIQSSFTDAKDVWRSFPSHAQQTLVDKNINIFFIDAISLAQEQANQENNTLASPFDLQHLIFKSAFFKTTSLTNHADKTEEQTQIVLGDNLELIQQSYHNLQQLVVTEMTIGDTATKNSPQQSTAPLLLQKKPANESAIASIHRFWNQTGSIYNKTNISADPFIALGLIPASTGIFADMSSLRSHHLIWIPEKCTGCESCYRTDSDNAIYGLVNTVNEVFETNIKRVEKKGHVVKHLRRAIRAVERKYHELTANKSTGTDLTPIFAKAIGDTIKEYAEAEREEVAQEFEWFTQAQGDFKFALTTAYHEDMNSHMPRSGGLFSITIDPNSHKGGIDCTSECKSLVLVEQTEESLQSLRDKWDYWLDLPTTNKKYSRIDDLQTKQGVLHTLLLDKKNHHSLFSSGNTRSASSEPIALHLFTSTITALMQPRVEQHIKHINNLISEMEKHIRLQLVDTLDISDIDALETAIDENQNVDLTLSRLSGSLDKDRATQPIDPIWLKWALQIVAKLKYLKWSYIQGLSGEGRANLGMTAGSDKTAPWSAPFPFNPYPFPWASHLSQHAPSLAMGLFEGHMVKMAEGFKAIRTAELEIKGKYDPSEHEKFFAHFDWRQFSEEEYLLCPPLISLGSEGNSFNSGLQNLSNSLVSGMPIKILVLDNQPSQPPDSLRKELGLIAMAHRTAYFNQSSISNTTHLLEGYIDGLNYRGPAIWSIYTSSQAESSSLTKQSQLAVESRAYPLITFDPRLGSNWEECINLIGNPEIDQNWVTYSLDYTDEYGNNFSMDIPLTYADWALTESCFSHHFKSVSADTGTDNMVLLTEFIDMDSHGQENNIPFIWAVHPQTNHLLKVVVSATIVKATREQRDYWHTLKGLSGDNKVVIDTQAIADQAKAEMAQTITEGLMSMVGGDAGALSRILADVPAISTNNTTVPVTKPIASTEKKAEKKIAPEPIEKPKKKSETADKVPADSNGASAHEPVWIETPDCTTCDECVDIAPAIFQYNEEKKAIVIDPSKGTFEEIVRSAEKCTAVIIHPGTPWNLDEPNLEQLIKRAEKFQ